MPAYQQIFYWYYDEPTPPYVLITHLKGDGADEGLVITDEVPGRTWAPFTGSQFTSATHFKFGNAALRGGSGSTIYLTSPVTDFRLDTDYTVEMWIYTTAVPGAVTPLYLYEACGPGKDIQVIVGPADNPLAVRHKVGAFFVDAVDGNGSPFGRWIHVYAGKQGTNIYAGMNGTVAGIDSVTETIVEPLLVLANSHPNFVGGGHTYMDEFWILKGGCRYTGNFTVIEPPLLP
jgi:hypothetical protein